MKASSRRKFYGGLLGIVLWLALSAPLSQAAATYTASLEKNVIRAGETTRLTVSANSNAGEELNPPQFSQINGLSINYLGQTKNESSFSWINGQMTSSRSLEWEYEVIALAEGKYSIANVQSAGAGGGAQPLILTVLAPGAPTPTQQPGAASAPQTNPYGIFITAECSKKEAYVGEEIILSYDAYFPSNRNIRAEKLEDRRGQFQGFWTEIFDYGQDRNIQRLRLANNTIADRLPLIVYILYPLKPGEQSIEPLSLICQVPERSDVFGFPFGRTQRVSVASGEVKIKAIPLPEEGKPDIFQGAVGTFKLTGRAENTDIRAGDTVTLKVALEGMGNIRNAPSPVLPDLTKFDEFPSTKKEDIRVTKDGASGRVEYTYVLMPRDANANHIDPIRFAYFDPAKKQYFVLQTQPIDLNIQAVSGQRGGGFLNDRRIINRVGDDFRYIETSPLALSIVYMPIYRRRKFWMALILPILLLALGHYRKNRRRYLEGNPDVVKSKKAPRLARKLLADARKALSGGDPERLYSHLGKAITDYISHRWNFSSAGMTSLEIKQTLCGRGVEEDCAGRVILALEELDAARFSGAARDSGRMQSDFFKTERILSEMMKQR
ncbi:MAG: BatD family protein [Candidatus Omnitrophota bacterium]